ncbi:MAG: DUF2178 domain-containing protein [Candidatus Paceibacterota bacterium]|jgi:uncharacterized membrane protein
MDIKNYNKIRLVIAAVLGGMVSFFVVQGNYLLPIIAAVAAFAVVLFMRRRVKGVINDERDYYIAGNASRWTISIYAILAAVSSMVFMALKSRNPSFEALGSFLAYSACFILILNSILFRYFSKKELNEK